MNALILLALILSPAHADVTANLYTNATQPLISVDHLSIQFPQNYVVARERFRTKAANLKGRFPNSELGFYKVASTVDKDLTTDHFFIPQPGSKKLLIVTSGIHGAEAYAGHSVQMLLMEKILNSKTAPKFNILFIHALNPYGFKYFRRTNENNVDLNRNFATAEEFKSINNEYEKLKTLFQPEHVASGYSLSRIGFYAQTAWVNITQGKKAILGAIRGQYQHPKGIFYGGTETQAEIKALKKLIKTYADRFNDLYLVDLHTGFGEKNKLHFFGSEQNDDAKQLEVRAKIFADYKIDTGNDKDFYKTTGDFNDWFLHEYTKKRTVAMTYEFGTMDSQTLIGGLRSLWMTVLDNQGHQNGYLSKEDAKQSLKDFEKLFNPQSEEWQKAILNGGNEAFDKTLKNFEAL